MARDVLMQMLLMLEEELDLVTQVVTVLTVLLSVAVMDIVRTTSRYLKTKTLIGR